MSGVSVQDIDCMVIGKSLLYGRKVTPEMSERLQPRHDEAEISCVVSIAVGKDPVPASSVYGSISRTFGRTLPE